MKEVVWVVKTNGDSRLELEAWLALNKERNGFTDRKVLDYPLTEIYKAVKDGKTLGYQPVQVVVMMESFAPNPEATPLEKGRALLEMTKAAVLSASQGGAKEIYHLSSDPLTEEGAKLFGFQEVPMKVMRLKLP